MQRATWTKKNHKYIRKEGNRYIYPEDVNKTPKARKLVDTITDTSGNKVSIRGAAATKTIANRSNRYDRVSGERLSASEVRRRNATSSQGTTDYKKLSEQKANRSAAANGKVVNPTYNMKDESGKTIFRMHSNDKVMPTAAQSYAKEQTLQKKQVANRLSNGSNAKNQEYAKQQVSAQKRKSALSKQGSSNHYQDAKDFKEYQDWEKNDLKKRDFANKRKEALNNQGKVDRQNQTKHTLYEKKIVENKIREKVESENKEIEKKETEKKIKEQKGHFTLKDGKTTFVSDDAATNKRVSKGKQIVDKIKGLFRKKTDREKGLIGTRDYRTYEYGSPTKDGEGYKSEKVSIYDTQKNANKAIKKGSNKPKQGDTGVHKYTLFRETVAKKNRKDYNNISPIYRDKETGQDSFYNVYNAKRAAAGDISKELENANAVNYGYSGTPKDLRKRQQEKRLANPNDKIKYNQGVTGYKKKKKK